jgi:hypothetical protein
MTIVCVVNAYTTVTFERYGAGLNCTGAVSKSTYNLNECFNQYMYVNEYPGQVWRKNFEPSTVNCGVFTGSNNPVYWINQCYDDIYTTVA